MNTEKQVNHSNTPVQEKNDRVGLWVGLGAAALTAIGVVGLAVYTDYQEAQHPKNQSASAQVAEQTPSSIPTSETQAASIATTTSAVQSQGMTAPSDVGDDHDDAVVVMASQVVIAPTAIASAATVGAPATSSSAIAASVPSPAQAILAKEQQAESKVVAENGVVHFYFATGKSDVTSNTLESLKETVEGVKGGKKAVIVTYSNVESNERLARDRALAVRSVLLAAGIPDSSIEVGNPVNAASSGDGRRVDVVLR